MKDLLQFNICGLESSFVLDVDVPDLSDRVEKAIPSHLFYACKHWSDHSVRSYNVHAPILKDFLNNRVLFWMEVMNLKKCIGLAASILSDLCDWVKRADVSDDVCTLCLDAQGFASVFAASPAHTSTPHIYVSILALWNRDRPVWTQYGMRANGLVGAEGPALNNREPGRVVSWALPGMIKVAAVSHDGRRVVTCSVDRKMHVWDTYTGTLLVGPFVEPPSPVQWVAFSPDDTRIASSNRQTLCVWDAHTGHPLGAPFGAHQSKVKCVAFSPDGSRLASGLDDGTIRIWDTQTGQPVIGPLEWNSYPVHAIAYSPGGDRILSASYDDICIWDAQTGDLIDCPFNGDRVWQGPVAFSPDGSYLVSGSDRGTIRVWDVNTGQKLDSFNRHQGLLLSLVFSPDGSHLVFHYCDVGSICVWDMVKRCQVDKHDLENWDVVLFAFLPNGYHILVIDEYEINIWDSQASQARLNAEKPDPLTSMAFSPDGGRVASALDDGRTCIWDAQTGEMLVELFDADIRRPKCVTFSPDGGRIASNCIWDTRTGRKVVEPFGDSAPTSLAYSPDGSRLVSSCSDGTICIWDSHTGSVLAGPFRGHTGRVNSVAYSPDGKHVVSGSSDNTVRVWDACTGQTTLGPLQGHTGWDRGVAFSPNGSRIVSGSVNHTIRVWDAQTGHLVGDPFKGHDDVVTSVAYSPTGSQIVSGSVDGTVRVWDAETGNTVATFDAHRFYVRSVAYSSDGTCFASGSNDRTIRIWRSQTDSGSDDPLENWTMNKYGWIVGNDSSMLLWVPSHLQPALLWPQNIGLIRPQGFLRLRFKDACIGPRWAECYTR
ncbi:hypothetical protein FRC06_001481 [Ceratobasidium sp. 370]|nr:hypothetical protein FRC06_001481 [Ceratobasidium sp. 370]